MATAWPTLSRNMDWGSTIAREPQIDLNKFGDGYVVRMPLGINNLPATFTIVYNNLSQSDYSTLIAFVKAKAASGAALTIPLLPEDRTGATTGNFFIKSFSVAGDILPSMTIVCEEVFVA